MSQIWKAQYDGTRDAQGEPNEVAQPSQGTPAPAPSTPVHKQGGIVHRVQVSDDGQTSYSVSQAASKSVAAEVPSSFGINEVGSKVRLDEITSPKAVLDLAGYGTSSAEVYESMGLVKKLPGGGYALVTPDPLPTVAAKDAPPAPPATTEDADDASISAVGIEPTSAVTDLVKNQLQRSAGPMAFNGLVQGLIRNQDITGQVEDIARRSGREPQEIKEAVEGVFGEYRSRAVQIAAAQGVPAHAFESFITWAASKAPDQSLDAFTTLVEGHDVRGVARLARIFAKTGQVAGSYPVADVLNAQLGDGVEAFEKDGAAWVRLRGHANPMTFAQAVRAGYIRVR